MKLPAVDAVVIGAGAGGGIMAEQLALAGKQVVLLERGRALKFADTGHDELRSQRRQSQEHRSHLQNPSAMTTTRVPTGARR